MNGVISCKRSVNHYLSGSHLDYHAHRVVKTFARSQLVLGISSGFLGKSEAGAALQTACCSYISAALDPASCIR